MRNPMAMTMPSRFAPFLMALSLATIGFQFTCPLSASEYFLQDESQVADHPEDKEQGLSEAQKLEAEQKLLADRYKLLEEKLFTLHEFEKGSNPIRSKLLERAFLQSQEKMTTSQMKMIVKLLTKTNLKDAENEQDEVLSQLNSLLKLLQSEDRGKRVRDEIQRHQEYLKEVERILRIQKGIRGQAEGGVEAKRLINSENKTAERTRKLATDIRENEDVGSKAESTDDTIDPNSGAQGEGSPSSTEGSGENPKEPEQNTPNGQNPDSDSEPGKDDSSSGSSEEGGSGEGGSNGQNSPQENPIRKRIEAAEAKMRDAQEKLEKALREDAVDAMKAAEKEMALAKQELEEILRQLREEEIERTLAMLEGRFRQMLLREVKIFESTQSLDRIPLEQRATDFEIRAGKLSVEQNSIATEAARALLLLKEDGSSVAFPATVDEMHQDMLQVAARLSAAKVGRITLEIQEDIIDTLEYLVQALVTTQQDMERMKQQSGQQGGGQPGDKPLVDRLAEIKMLRGLQDRILRRHRRYSRFLDDPDDPVGSTDDPELQAALLRLAIKQAQLTDIAREIVNEKNK